MSHGVETIYTKRIGQLTKVHGTSFKEFMVLNYTRHKIATMDHLGTVTHHHPSASPSLLRDNDKIVILSRSTTTGVQLDAYGADISEGIEGRTTLSINDLYESPRYIPDIDQVVFLKDHSGGVIHPRSTEHLERITLIDRQECLNTALYSPMLLMARVSSDHPRFKRIYSIVHSRIISAPTVYDGYINQVRTGELSDGTHEFCNQLDITYNTDKGILHRTTHNLDQLDKENPDGVYFINGGYFSFDKDALSQKLKDTGHVADVEINTNLIAKDEHRKILTQKLDEAAAERKHLEDIIKVQEYRLKSVDRISHQIRDHHGDLKTVFELTEQLAQGENILKRTKIELDTLKAQTALDKANRDAVHKRHEEVVKTIGHVAKAVAIIAPVALGIFKYIKSN